MAMMPVARDVVRAWRRHPARAALAIVVVALGVSAVAIAFTVADQVLWHSVPFPHASRLVWLGESSPRLGEDGTSLPALARWRNAARTLRSVGAFTSRHVRLTLNDGMQQVPAALVSYDLLPTLGVAPWLGRGLVESDDRPSSAPVVLISDGLWRRQFHARRDVIGQILRIDGLPRTIVGVMPPGFTFPGRDTDVWIPVARMLAAFENTEGALVVNAIGRLRDGATPAAATRELDAIAARAGRIGTSDHGYRPFARDLTEQLTRTDRPRVTFIFAAALLVLLLAGASLGNALVMRLMREQRDAAIRRALGMSDSALLARLLLEYGGLGLAGIVAGAALSVEIVRLASRFSPRELPELSGVRLPPSAMLTASAAAILLCVSLAILAQRHIARAAPRTRLAEAAAGASPRLRLARQALAITQFALSLALLCSAGVLSRTFVAFSHRELGFSPQAVYVARLARPVTVLTPRERPLVRQFMHGLTERLGQAPGVADAAVATERPGGGTHLYSAVSTSARSEPFRAGVIAVSARYFAALRIGPREGRLLRAADMSAEDSESGSVAAVLDEPTARMLFDEQPALGQELRLDDLALTVRVVGVVNPIAQQGPGATHLPQIYLPYDALSLPWVSVVLRTRLDSAQALSELRTTVAGLDPEQTISNFSPLGSLLASTLDRSRFYSILLGAFAVLAIALTGIALYGLLAMIVVEQRRELGIRLCLGASARAILLLIARQGLVIVGAGIAAGTLVTLAFDRSLRSLLFGLSPFDPLVLLASALCLGAVAIAASIRPAVQAARTDPIRSLRDE